MTLYEAEDRCGGHTLTADACGVPVDLGFQVHAHGGAALALPA